jgi:hypothetical protein
MNVLSTLPVEGNVSNKAIISKINELVEALNAAQTPRDRGPKSEKTMTDDDARRVISGDLKAVSHKLAAETLGLSYGQVYSARKGFTFKPIHKEVVAPKETASA